MPSLIGGLARVWPLLTMFISGVDDDIFTGRFFGGVGDYGSWGEKGF